MKDCTTVKKLAVFLVLTCVLPTACARDEKRGNCHTTDEIGREISEVTWSPDGAYLAYTGLDLLYDDHDIWIYDWDTHHLKNLTDDLPGQQSSPIWSLDSQQIAFTSIPPATMGNTSPIETQVINVDGTNLTTFTPDMQQNLMPTRYWGDPMSSGREFPSPDGTQIAFLDPEPEDRLRIERLFIKNADGSNVREVEVPTSRYGRRPLVTEVMWSPDSQSFIYFTGSSRSGTIMWVRDIRSPRAVGLLREGCHYK